MFEVLNVFWVFVAVIVVGCILVYVFLRGCRYNEYMERRREYELDDKPYELWDGEMEKIVKQLLEEEQSKSEKNTTRK